MHPAFVKLQEAAEARAVGDVLIGFGTSEGKDNTPIAICDRRSGLSYVVLVERQEYDGIALAHLLGFPDAPRAAPVVPDKPPPKRRKR
jgi:hypothetical protein